MTEVRFYHLHRRRLEEVLPVMLERSLERGWRVVVMARSPQRVEALNAHLWTYSDRSFLSHGCASDGFADHQPIWLTTKEENPNRSRVLFLTDGAISRRLDDFELVCELIDGNEVTAVTSARKRWQEYKSNGHDLTYWQQDENGRWARQTSV